MKGVENMEKLINELMKVVERICNKEDATKEEIEALAKVAGVIMRWYYI